MTKKFTKSLRNLYARITQPVVLALLKAEPIFEPSERLAKFVEACVAVTNVPKPRIYWLNSYLPNVAVMNWDSDRPILLVSGDFLSCFDDDENLNMDPLTQVAAKLFAHTNRLDVPINPIIALTFILIEGVRSSLNRLKRMWSK